MATKLIVLEGIDGVGKSEVSRSLAARLVAEGIDAVRYEDIESKAAEIERAKEFTRKSCRIEVSFLTHLASAVHKSTQIEDLLRSRWVICDRYVYSTIAYHVANGMDRILAEMVWNFPIKKPDHLFLLTTAEEERLSRVRARPDGELSELVAKVEGSDLWKKEKEFKRLIADVIDTTNASVDESVNGILSVVRGHGRASTTGNYS